MITLPPPSLEASLMCRRVWELGPQAAGLHNENGKNKDSIIEFAVQMLVERRLYLHDGSNDRHCCCTDEVPRKIVVVLASCSCE